MSAELKALCDLQAIDLALAKAQKSKASLDDGSSRKLLIADARQKVEEADGAFHQATAELHDNELKLKTVEEKQKSFKDKLYGGSVSNPKELESMEKEIEMLGRQKGKLEERILELYDIVEGHKSSLASAQATVKQLEDDLAQRLKKIRQEAATLTARIQELTKAREQALSGVDLTLLKRYESMRQRAGGVVVSKVEDVNCSACHTQIITGLMRELTADKTICTCENCGRLLYLEQ